MLPLFVPHRIDDRDYWSSRRTAPALASTWHEIDAALPQIPPRAPLPTAADYLAAKRHNDRGILDRHWRGDRTMLTKLLANALGKDDGDDRLLNWVFDFTFEPTWVVSAHLPDNDLPYSGNPQLDLAATEMAGELAECCEVMLPWLTTQSPNLPRSIIHEIDRRCLTPLANGALPWWLNPAEPTLNNWTGVCAGSLLMACLAMEQLGEPRPQVKQKLIAAHNLFFARAFTESGECDEGPIYWQYGVEYACLPLQRMTLDEIRGNFDIERIRAVGVYPSRCHVFGNYFLAGNDSTSRIRPFNSFVPWLAEFADSDFLRWWGSNYGESPSRSINGMLREMHILPTLDRKRALPAPAAQPHRLLPDQQIAIFQRPCKAGLFTFALTGGHNAESHNHNDLGSFQLIINDVPWLLDLGMADYTSDFFGPQRYTKYIVASSAGHCCPSINGFEQRATRNAAARITDADVAAGHFALDLTSAYPAEAQLALWQRRAQVNPATAEVKLTDRFTLANNGTFTYRIWFREKPTIQGTTITCGPLVVMLSDKPDAVRVIQLIAGNERLREFPADQILYRVDCDYPASAGQTREIHALIRCE